MMVDHNAKDPHWYERQKARRQRALARLARRQGKDALAALWELYERQTMERIAVAKAHA